LRFGDVTVETTRELHIIEVPIFLGDAKPDAVLVELCAEAVGDARAVRHEMDRLEPVAETGATLYRGTVSSSRPATDYTPRISPHCGGLAVPFELDWIRWQK